MFNRFPYNLSIHQKDSFPAHQHIADFTDRWLAYIRKTHCSTVLAYQDFRAAANHKEIGFAESVLELTALSVNLREHLQEASRFSPLGAGILSSLVELQDRLPWFERPVKFLRGLVFVFSAHSPTENSLPPKVGRQSLAVLMRWLRAQGQSILSEHFAVWDRHFQQMETKQNQAALQNCLLIADQFSAFSLEVLGLYTHGANHFQLTARGDSSIRYDHALRGRSRAEYHLGLLGTEILNREFRQGFLKTQNKLVIVPRCMRAKPANKCKAVPARLGTRCTGCTPQCQVNLINQFCKPHNISVADIPDDQLKFLCRASGQAGSGLGVLGLSCAPTNWLAGWEAQKLGLHAQGLLLDFPACREHWHPLGLPTSTSMPRLKLMLEIESDNIVQPILEESQPVPI